MQTHYKETASFLYTYYFSCHTLEGVNTGFAKGEALRHQDQIHHAQRLIKEHKDFQICLKE